jgi:organic radical activating enzyme
MNKKQFVSKPVEQVEQELNQISPSFCLAKWTQLSLHLQLGHGHSCHHPRTHKINLDEIAADPSNLHNTSQKIKARQEMLEGKRPFECNYCWKIEDAGEISDRPFKSSLSWSYPYKQQIIDGTFKNPSYLEVSFDSTCNFKCAYCGPSISSSWLEEIKQMGPYPTSDKFNNLDWIKSQQRMPILKREENLYVDAFWEWWPSLVKDLQVFRITGGEPLLSKDFWRVLDTLEETPQPNLSFSVNTNLGVPQQLLDKFYSKLLMLKSKVKDIRIYTSVDTYGEQAEYIRYGLNFKEFLQNTYTILDLGIPLTYMMAINALSIPNAHLFFYEIQRQRKKYNFNVQFDTPYVRFPQFLSIELLTPDFKPYWENICDFFDANEEFKKYECQRVRRLLALIATEPTNINSLRKDFVKFVDEYDRRRNTNFCKTFPEMVEFYLMCKDIA